MPFLEMIIRSALPAGVAAVPSNQAIMTGTPLLWEGHRVIGTKPRPRAGRFSQQCGADVEGRARRIRGRGSHLRDISGGMSGMGPLQAAIDVSKYTRRQGKRPAKA